jgi:hypothetical protein
MKRSQARLLLPTAEAAQVERLATGEAVLWRTNGATAVVKIPNTTALDVQHVAWMVTGNGYGDGYAEAAPPSATHAPGTRHLRVVYTSPDHTFSASERSTAHTDALAPEAAHLLARYTAGATMHELTSEQAGTSNTNARAYREARAHVEATIRAILAQRVGS